MKSPDPVGKLTVKGRSRESLSGHVASGIIILCGPRHIC